VYDGSNYYISTRNGIYTSTSGNADTWSLVSGSDKRFEAMIALPAVGPVAIARDGGLYKVSAGSCALFTTMDTNATSALAFWQDGSTSLLLAGRYGDVNSRGYRELTVSGGNFSGGFNEPSYSVSDNSQYKSGIGKLQVDYLFQVPSEIDSETPLFASTYADGLWSCRKKVWNAEE
jgi:hypothetical protein